MSETAVRSSRAGSVPWPAEFAARYTAKGLWAGGSLSALLAAAARRTPDAVCLVDGELRITFGELLARADGAAQRLAGLGVRPDDRVVVQLANCWEHVVLSVACLRLGALPVWTLPQHRRHEMAGVAAHTEARVLVVPGAVKDFDHQAMAHEVAAAVPSVRHVLVAGGELRDGSLDLHALLAPAEDPEAAAAALDAATPAGDAVAMFLLSGGTTGLPKVIPRTNNDLCYMIGQAAEICAYGPDTVYLATLPLGHGFPNTGPGVLGALINGGRVVITASPAPETALAIAARERVTTTAAVPAIVQRWLQFRDEHPDLDLSALTLLQVGAARLAPAVARQIGPKLGCTLMQVFGMGEGLLCLTRLDDPEQVLHHTQGRPVSPDDEVLIVDETGVEVPPGEPGLLLTRGPYTLRGYYASPDLNARAFTEDGWYVTGDVVRRTPEGNLIVAGREKDVINRGGEKINAEEIENFAHQLDAVDQAAAVAMPDAELGETVCLFVVPKAGRRVTLDEVRSVLLDAGVARFKLPERLVLADTMPATPIGKVDKKALRSQIARLLDAEATEAL
ncbi:AMP-binding protein [Kitasatospora sp. NPDC049285]|uniref:(2,3-dihydroxybenzoyl)adenylate synthase n=1 Tax=Kitasatospora sp. NPDC049285 TaxID=3157096 RepID=UPI003427A057